MDVGLLFSILIWQCTGFDQMTDISGEVHNPQRSYPLAFGFVILFAVLTYLFPLTAGLMNQNIPEVWNDGIFGIISRNFIGCQNGWLAIWLTISGCLCLLGVLNVCVTCNAREVLCGAQIGNLPFCKWLGVLSHRSELCKCWKKQQKHEEDVEEDI